MESAIQCVYMRLANLFHANKMTLSYVHPQSSVYGQMEMRSDPRWLGSRCTSQRTAELEGNGDSCMVLAEEYRSMNTRVSHHRVVSDVPRDAQT